MPPWDWCRFYMVTNVDPGAGLQAAVDILGVEGVCAGITEDGVVIIELGSDDVAAVEQAAAALQEHFGETLSGGHTVVGGFVTG
jgi:hypothetical protein